jgi:hypothetical protein
MTSTQKDYNKFTNKEVFLKLLDDLNKKTDEMKSYLEKHIDWCKVMSERYIPELNKLQEQFIHICDELPNKGFCGKVDKMYDDMYPKEGESIPDKVDILWYDRKIMKWILATSVSALIIGLISLFFGSFNGVL